MLRSWPTHVHTLYNVGDLTLNGHLLGHCPTGYYSIYRDYSTLHAANPSMMNLPNVSFRLFHCYYYYCAHYVVLLLSGFDAVSRRPSPPASACVTRAGWLCNGDSLSSLQDNPPDYCSSAVHVGMLPMYGKYQVYAEANDHTATITSIGLSARPITCIHSYSAKKHGVLVPSTALS
jgi:hypothetical protein